MGVTHQDPVVLGINGLVKLCKGRRVVSIDTALIHLCAAMGNKADLLLPRFPDERWVELSFSTQLWKIPLYLPVLNSAPGIQ